MKTYTKNYSELSSEEKMSFLILAECDSCMNKILENRDAHLDLEVAFAIGEDGALVAVDYRIFDPMHTNYGGFTYADGWSNWLLENYNEDEETDKEMISVESREGKSDYIHYI